MLKILLIAALQMAASPPPADGVRPPPEALVSRLLAVLPGGERLGRVERAADPQELDRLARLNPGRTEEIRGILEAFHACEGPIRNAMIVDMIRATANRMGEQKVSRLVAFYEGDDLRTFNSLIARSRRGETLSPAETAEIDRIMSAYPLAEFSSAMRAPDPRLWQGAVAEDLARCEGDKEQVLNRLGLRSTDEAD